MPTRSISNIRSTKKKTSTTSTKTRRPVKKTSKTNKKNNINTSKIYSTLTVGLFTVFVLFGLLIYRSIDARFASADSVTSTHDIDKSLYAVVYIRVVDMDDDLSVSSVRYSYYDVDENKILTFDLPLSEKIEFGGMFGQDTIKKSLNLLMVRDNNDFDLAVSDLVKLIDEKMGYSAERYFISDRVVDLSGSTLPLSVSDLFKGSFKTNIKMTDAFKILSFSKSLPVDRVVNVELPSFNSAFIDEQTQELTFDTKFSKEGFSISLLNGTNYSGLASVGERVIKNMGGRVVHVGNTSEYFDKSMIVAKDPASFTVRELVRSLGITNVVSADSVSLLENQVDRSDITIIFGSDYIKAN